MNKEHLRFAELLPWYVNGTLAGADRVWVDAYLKNHQAEAAVELAAWRTLETQTKENIPVIAADIGLQKALVRIHAEKAARVPAAKHLSAFERFTQWLFGSGNTGFARFSPALGLALAVIALQAVVIGKSVVDAPDFAQVRGAKTGLADGPLLRVNFKADATENQIRLMLIDNRALIVAGPTQLGDYFIKVADARMQKTETQFRASPFVEAVAVVPTLPEELVDR